MQWSHERRRLFWSNLIGSVLRFLCKKLAAWQKQHKFTFLLEFMCFRNAFGTILWVFLLEVKELQDKVNEGDKDGEPEQRSVPLPLPPPPPPPPPPTTVTKYAFSHICTSFRLKFCVVAKTQHKLWPFDLSDLCHKAPFLSSGRKPGRPSQAVSCTDVKTRFLSFVLVFIYFFKHNNTISRRGEMPLCIEEIQYNSFTSIARFLWCRSRHRNNPSKENRHCVPGSKYFICQHLTSGQKQ